jgi:hypothetical protein
MFFFNGLLSQKSEKNMQQQLALDHSYLFSAKRRLVAGGALSPFHVHLAPVCLRVPGCQFFPFVIWQHPIADRAPGISFGVLDGV